MEKKQTAVEWLYEQIKFIDKDTYNELELKFQQAKEMEKEQIEEAYWDGGQDVPIHGKQCEQYYNETYKQSKQ